MRNKLKEKTGWEQITRDFALLSVTSPVFSEKGHLPLQYTCDGADMSPSLDIKGLPKGTTSLAIIMEDIDAPGGRLVHWLAWDIPPLGHLTEGRRMEAEGLNDLRTHGYKGPCPSYSTHHYTFHVYALDTMPALPRDTKEPGLRDAVNGHILGYGKITGLYKRV